MGYADLHNFLTRLRYADLGVPTIAGKPSGKLRYADLPVKNPGVRVCARGFSFCPGSWPPQGHHELQEELSPPGDEYRDSVGFDKVPGRTRG